MKKHTTNTKTDKRTVIAIKGYPGKALALPASLQKPYSEFTIGKVRFYFKNSYTALEALDPVPASWLIDLSADVLDLSET